MKKRNWDKTLIFIFQILFALFCLMTAVLSILCFTIGFDWLIPGHDSSYYDLIFNNKLKSLLFAFIWLCVALLCYLILKQRYLKSSSIISNLIILGVIAFVLRGLLVLSLGKAISPVSDFASSWLMTKGDTFYLSHYRFFPAYINYAVFMRLICRFFNYNYLSVLWSDVFIGTITTIGIYFLSYEVYENDYTSITASLIYALYPPAILYTGINTPEHLCVMAMVWGLYFFIKALKRSSIVLSIIYAILFGILAGISNSMKSFYPIVLVAIIITLIFYLISCKWKPKKILIATLILVMVIGAETITMKGISSVSGKLFNIEIDYSSALPHFVLVGLNRQGEGQINIGNLSRTYNDLIESGVDNDTAKEIAYKEFKEDWKGHLNEVPSFITKKLIWGFQDDCSPSRILSVSVDEGRLSSIGNKIWTPLQSYSEEVSQIIYCLICVSVLVAALVNFKSKETNLYAFLLELVVFGYFCLILLSESQSRYKCLIIPYLIIIAASLNNKKDYD